MGTFNEEFDNLIKNVGCLTGQAGSAAAGALGQGLRTLPGGEVVAVPLEGVSNAVSRFLCPADPVDLPGTFSPGGSDAVPGACGVDYRLAIVATYVPFGETELVTRTLKDEINTYRGPLGDTVVRLANSSSVRVGWTNLSENASVEIFYQPGTFEQIEFEGAPERLDNQPDSCSADGTPVPPGGSKPTYTGPLTYDTRDGPVTVDVTVTVDNPLIDDDGNLIIPFVYVDPDLEVNPRVKVDVDPEVGFGDGGCCGPKFDPELPEFPDNPDDPELPASDTRYIGVVVSATRLSPFATVGVTGDGDVPDVYSPRLGSVVFSVVVGRDTAWLAPIDVRLTKQYIPVPGFIPAFGWEIKEANGWSITVSPVPLAVADTIVLA